MNEFMHVAEIALPLLLQGLGTTAAISVLSILIAMVLGSAVGYMCLCCSPRKIRKTQKCGITRN